MTNDLNQTRFVDLQVNGYGGIDFNSDNVTADDFRVACSSLVKDGIECVLATIITDSLPAMERRLSAIVHARDADGDVRRVLTGIHIEGPFLNETAGYIGAHPHEHALPASDDAMQRLLDAAGGLTRIVTLAPERDEKQRVTRKLSDSGIVVSAGHCNPTLDELDAAIDAGLSMFTHLGNGCPLQQHRHDNIVQRVLSRSSNLMIGFIADGVHVPLFALQNYIKCAGFDRCFVVTDAISAAGQGPGEYQLAGQTVVVDEQLATWTADKSHLVGSASTMPHLVANLQSMQFDSIQIEALTRTNPLKAIGQAP
ncbi:MAG: N-acetylglucosamine-6-phosphate deacetylase [Planctomycetales bacterium]|nr:N-acetylglucosamine-6-phosphate deacetylase [Planctomycetales bacterium]